MIKIIINLLFILFFSCSDRHDRSFDYLSESFIKWHKKYSLNLFEPPLDMDIGYEGDKEFIGNIFYSDIKRFSIELNQINQKKLSYNHRDEYSLLSRYLDCL